MNGFERRKQIKMKQIEDAAFSLFIKIGVQKVSIQDIAKKANVSQVTIYNYFGSKDDLLLYVYKNYLNLRLQQFEDIIESRASYKARIHELISLKLDDIDVFNTESIGSIMVSQGPLAELFQDYTTNKMIPIFTRFLQEGKENGVLSPLLSIDTIIFFLTGLQEGLYKQKDIFLNPDNKTQFKKEILHLLFYGLVGKDS
ncbi:TetR/AcrR family transcriptional regulator [Bacillus sp. 2205SS5-2]|uniref:TetR/AcrR family transcriptional regulator n=1 Tax=Bacillus sp. 2205SS5-2 TaxID=3109031 RepID=UPI003007B746